MLRSVRASVQPVAMSVTVSEQAESPLLAPPSCPTKSISTKPGVFSSQSAQVRIGICAFSSEPGLVWEIRDHEAGATPSALDEYLIWC